MRSSSSSFSPIVSDVQLPIVPGNQEPASNLKGSHPNSSVLTPDFQKETVLDEGKTVNTLNISYIEQTFEKVKKYEHESIEFPVVKIPRQEKLLDSDGLDLNRSRQVIMMNSSESVLEYKILIVDDCPHTTHYLHEILNNFGYYQIVICHDPANLKELLQNFKPDLLLLDWHLPSWDGVDILDLINLYQAPNEYFPVLVITASKDPIVRQQALTLGATDFLTKPFDAIEVTLRIGNLLKTKQLHDHLRFENHHLELVVAERTRHIDEAHLETLERLALAAEFRDDDTHLHTQRVGCNAAILAKRLGLSDQIVQLIRRAAPLHDIGKIGIPDSILLKQGPLLPEEFELMKTHTTIGKRILSNGKTPLIQMAELIALSHHERWDGSGYPNRLKEKEIPLSARIVAVVDVFDALIHPRPYKRAWAVAEALDWMIAQKGKSFDPKVLDAFQSGIESAGYDLT